MEPNEAHSRLLLSWCGDWMLCVRKLFWCCCISCTCCLMFTSLSRLLDIYVRYMIYYCLAF